MVRVLVAHGVYVPNDWDTARVEELYLQFRDREPEVAPEPWVPGSPRG